MKLVCLVMICLVMICLVMICLVMICLWMTCLWMCPMRLFLLRYFGGGCSCSSGVGCLFSCEPLSVGGPAPSRLCRQLSPAGGKRRCSVDAADGIEYLIEQVREFGRDVTVLATGPLTDVDAAITRAPDIASKLRLVMMGGTLTQPGNCWDAVAETNIIQDPEAANRVFHSGADITMVGLDVTHQCLLPQSAADRWRATGTKRGRFLADLADFSIKANLEADPALFSGGMPLHDPLAAAVALDSSLVDV